MECIQSLVFIQILNLGQPVSQSHFVNSKYVLSFGLPKHALLNIASEFFLADVGIPKLVFQRVLKGASFIPPFGDKFIVGLIRK